jgi:hypothetical protein
VGSREELLLLDMVEVAADRRRRDIGRGRDLIDLELAPTREWLEHCVQAFVSVHAAAIMQLPMAAE